MLICPSLCVKIPPPLAALSNPEGQAVLSPHQPSPPHAIGEATLQNPVATVPSSRHAAFQQHWTELVFVSPSKLFAELPSIAAQGLPSARRAPLSHFPFFASSRFVTLNYGGTTSLGVWSVPFIF